MNNVHIEEKAYSFYTHIQLLEKKISELILTMEFCKIGVIHSHLFKDIIKQIPSNITLISKDNTIIWENTIIYCSYNNKLFHVIVKLPIQERTYIGHLIVPTPIIINHRYKEIDITNPLVIKKDKQLYKGNCILDTYYYCKQLQLIENKCILNIVNNANKKECTYMMS